MENTAPQYTIVKNKDWETAWRIANDTDTNLFLTGKAGTGKTTFLRYLKEHSEKRIVVLAPTGIAAINAQGVTIHSFFQLPFSPFVPGTVAAAEQQSHYRFSKEKLKIIRGVDLIVIDEISMVRADLLDAIDSALKRFRRNSLPFGGVQLLMIGDLQQLAPVVKEEEWAMLSQYYASPYFFDSNALRQTNYATVELKHVFRQDDEKFIGILNKIRENKADAATLNELNRRYIPDFKPAAGQSYIRLTTHNAYAQSVNESELQALQTSGVTFDADISGNYPEYSYPTERRLTLKKGAQVMFVKNDTSGNHAYYNGMIGEVSAISSNGFSVISKDNGDTIDVGKEIWQNCKYKIDKEKNEIVEEVEGTFEQYPVKLAWAITIHKSQGLTFRHAIIDVHSSFAHGQTYVALSRCKTLEGLVLTAPVTQSAIICDSKVDGFTRSVAERHTTDSDLLAMQNRYMINLLTELFNFHQLEGALQSMTRVLDEHLYKAYPNTLTLYKRQQQQFHSAITDVAMRFAQQYRQMAAAGNGISDELQERISKGARYFMKEIQPLKELFQKGGISTNNKQIKEQLANAAEALADALRMKENMLRYAADEDFSTGGYVKAKAKVLLGEDIRTKGARKAKNSAKAKVEVTDDNLHPTLFDELTEWRREKAQQGNMPAYCILSQKALTGVSNLLPVTTEALTLIPGIGKAKSDKYGTELLSIVKRYIKEHG